MCFSKKMKVPKPNTDQKAPEPVLLEAPKGIEFGDGADDSTEKGDDTSSAKGLSSLKVKKEAPKGDGSQATSAPKDTGATPSIKKSSPIKRALKR